MALSRKNLIGNLFSIELELASNRYNAGEGALRNIVNKSEFWDNKYRRDHFQNGYDPSIRPTGSEFRLCFLKKEDLSHIPFLLKELQSFGFYSNNTCGIHIHVDIEDFLMKHRGRDGEKPDFEPATETVWREIRQRSNEFRPYARRSRYVGNGQYRRDKYSAVNIFTSFETIEVRLFNSVMNTRYISRAVDFARETVNLILNRTVEENTMPCSAG